MEIEEDFHSYLCYEKNYKYKGINNLLHSFLLCITMNLPKKHSCCRNLLLLLDVVHFPPTSPPIPTFHGFPATFTFQLTSFLCCFHHNKTFLFSMLLLSHQNVWSRHIQSLHIFCFFQIYQMKLSFYYESNLIVACSQVKFYSSNYSFYPPFSTFIKDGKFHVRNNEFFQRLYFRTFLF